MQSICILRLSAIGDVCHAVAIVQAIQRRYPHAAITWLVGNIESQLLLGLPGVRLLVFDKRQSWRSFQQLWRQLRHDRFDVLLHMQTAMRANLVSLCIRAHRRIGFDWHSSKEFHSLFVNERVSPVSGLHVLDGFREFSRAIGVPIQRPSWTMPIAHEYLCWAKQQVVGSGYDRHLVVCPAASKPERNWMPEYYAAVIDYAAKQGFAIWICGSSDDAGKRLVQAILNASQTSPTQLFNLLGKTHLQQLLALIRHATVVLGPDSGPVHMATAVGTPVIGLYAHSNPSRTGPYGSPYTVETYHRHLLAQAGMTANKAKWGYRVQGGDIMRSIPVDQVIAMFNRVLNDRGLLPRNSPLHLRNKALFLDRDGIINLDSGYVYLPNQFHFNNGIFKVCQHFQAQGYKIIVVTNQSGIARGYFSETQFRLLNRWMIDQFFLKGIHVTAVYYCPHHPYVGNAPYLRNCSCRKPSPGLFLQAIEEHYIDSTKSIMVGDKISDMLAAAGACIRERVLLETGPLPKKRETHPATKIISSLDELIPYYEAQNIFSCR